MGSMAFRCSLETCLSDVSMYTPVRSYRSAGTSYLATRLPRRVYIVYKLRDSSVVHLERRTTISGPPLRDPAGQSGHFSVGTGPSPSHCGLASFFMGGSLITHLRCKVILHLR